MGWAVFGSPVSHWPIRTRVPVASRPSSPNVSGCLTGSMRVPLGPCVPVVVTSGPTEMLSAEAGRRMQSTTQPMASAIRKRKVVTIVLLTSPTPARSRDGAERCCKLSWPTSRKLGYRLQLSCQRGSRSRASCECLLNNAWQGVATVAMIAPREPFSPAGDHTCGGSSTCLGPVLGCSGVSHARTALAACCCSATPGARNQRE